MTTPAQPRRTDRRSDTHRRLQSVRVVRYSHAPDSIAQELFYEQDWSEVEGSWAPDRRRALLVEVFEQLMGELSETERLCVTETIINGGYAIEGKKHTAWKPLARTIGINPETGEQIGDQTVKRAVHRGLAKLKAGLLALPDWQRVQLGLPDDDDLPVEDAAAVSSFFASLLGEAA